MVKVFVWLYRGKREAWGHAAMAVGKNYISWWPEQPGQVPSRIHANIYASAPFRYRAFEEDVAAEGQEPDRIVTLRGLKESAILDWWQGFGLSRDGQHYEGPLQSWDTLNRNCSTVVATGLHIGGGDAYADWVKTWNVIWTPADVLAYASSIRSGWMQAHARL